MAMFFCPLYSGSSGNAAFVATDKTALLVDAGVTAKRIGLGLADVGAGFGDIKGVLITHEHSDHIKGIGVLARRHNIPVYANAGTWSAILQSGRVGDIPQHLRIQFADSGDFTIGDIHVSPFAIPHDAAAPVGYALESSGTRVVTATDMGYMPKSVLSRLAGADVLMLEFNHDVQMLQNGPYPYHLKQRILSRHGHLCNEDAAKILTTVLNTGCRHFMLAHLSQENNTPEAAYDAAWKELLTMGHRPGNGVAVEVAPADRIGKAFVL